MVASGVPIVLADRSVRGLAAPAARDYLRDLVRVADHPHERRIIGLAAASAGEESAFIRQLLSEYEENQLTLAILEDR